MSWKKINFRVNENAGEQIRDSLELLRGEERLDKSAIKGLEELFESVTKLGKKVYVGTGAISASHAPLHEQFTMNGSDTSVALTQGVSAQGTAIFVRYQGQMLDLTRHYTVDGNKISFVGFTPAPNKIISITYFP